MAVTGILKINKIAGLGGVTPQVQGAELKGDNYGWTMVKVKKEEVSKLQEFNIQFIDDDIPDKLDKPADEGSHDEIMKQINGFGEKHKMELRRGEIVIDKDGNEHKIQHPDDLDDKGRKNYTVEYVAQHKEAKKVIDKINKKSVLRNNIRGNIKDIEDDLADMKIATQIALYYFVNEMKNNKKLSKFAEKVLSDNVKMRVDLKNGSEKLMEIFEDEMNIKKIVEEKYHKQN